VIAEFRMEEFYVQGDGKNSPLVREVSEFWVDQHTRVAANDTRRLVFVERYLGDRCEAWISVVEFDGAREFESGRWNAKKLLSIDFKEDPMPECRL
jgi:hypothetical protein